MLDTRPGHPALGLCGAEPFPRWTLAALGTRAGSLPFWTTVLDPCRAGHLRWTPDPLEPRSNEQWRGAVWAERRFAGCIRSCQMSLFQMI
eukprot:15461575-Alexandrium_andersonii.AAC.1